MSAERMTDERWAHLSQIAEGWCTSQQAEVRDELSRAMDEIQMLKKRLSDAGSHDSESSSGGEQ